MGILEFIGGRKKKGRCMLQNWQMYQIVQIIKCG